VRTPGEGRTSQNVAVRTAESADLDGVLELWRAAAHRESATDNIEALTAVLDHPHATLLVASDGDVLVGTALPAWDGWRSTVYRVVSRPGWEAHEEIGLALIAAAVTWLGQFGREAASAPVGDNADAHRLWQRAGFRHDARTLRFVHDANPTDTNGDQT
jgi:hypothetical protein